MKLKTEQRYDPNYTVTPSNATNPTNDGLSDYKNTDYVGNIVYETAKNGSVITNRTRILVDGGYYEGGVYYFYVTDHLGNNRMVVNQSGTVTQKNHYYPFGTAFADKYDNGTSQPYKYNGKELDQMHQLNLYDYSARYYESAVGRFTSVDPRAEDDYFSSPYVYAYNNPLRFTDPTGMTPNDSIKDGGTLNAITIEGTISAANTFAYYSLPMVSYADDADRAWNKGNYIGWIGNVLLGTGDGLLYFASLGSTSYIKGGSASLLKGTVKSGTRGLWVLSKKYAASIKSHSKWGTFYKSKSDGLWWVVDKTKHGGSEFKVFKETNQGLEWIHDADKYGDFISDKHKSVTGTFISWGELKTVY